jgi:hypothetical protein
MKKQVSRITLEVSVFGEAENEEGAMIAAHENLQQVVKLLDDIDNVNWSIADVDFYEEDEDDEDEEEE